MVVDSMRLAPMMGYTSAPFRLLIHLLSPKVQLYTEMVSVNAVIHNPKPYYFSRFPEENNTVFQLGGDHPKHSAEVAKQAEQAGFCEININCGCPSNRVQNANFGACLMQQPEKVAEMLQHMQKRVRIPISVKHRLGIDKKENYDFVHHFVRTLDEAGCRRIIVHARNAWLSGLSPRLNRKVPALKPEFVFRLKHDFPNLNICINGEINTVDKINYYLSPNASPPVTLDAVMVGRKIWDNPYLFAEALAWQGEQDIPTASSVINRYFQRVNDNLKWMQCLWSPQSIIRPLTNVFSGMHGAKKWRLAVSQPYHDLKEAESVLSKFIERMDQTHE